MKQAYVGILALLAVGTIAVAPAQAADAVPTFSKDVAPILFSKCATCHRPGEIAPMSLLSFEDARPWAKAMKDKVVAREMPPWGADSKNSMKMRNDRSLSDQQIATIVAWVDGGAPKGDPKDLPPQPQFAKGWQMGVEPDYTFLQPVEAHIAAEGAEPYTYFYEKIPFTEDRFAQKLELRPSNYSVVHHSGVYVVEIPKGYSVKDGNLYDEKGEMNSPEKPKGEAASTGEEEPLAGANKLLSYVPGRGYEAHPDGFVKRVPAGKYLRWVMHYNPTGKPEVDRSYMGLWWTKVAPQHEVLNLQAGDPVPGSGGEPIYMAEGKEIPYKVDEVSGRRSRTTPPIPAYADNYQMTGITPVTEPITLYSLTPHMHLRGKSMRWTITYPDGKEQTILDVPKYDFNWQIQYELETPLKVPAGSKITNVAVYDNSIKNRWNPSPQLEVYWSEQSWDEMYQPTTQFSVDSHDLSKKPATTQQQQQ